MRELNLLVRWGEEPHWHLVPSHNHGKTECERDVPRVQVALEYAETGRIENVKGICKRCYHEACINDQDPQMWEVYYKYVANQ